MRANLRIDLRKSGLLRFQTESAFSAFEISGRQNGGLVAQALYPPYRAVGYSYTQSLSVFQVSHPIALYPHSH